MSSIQTSSGASRSRSRAPLVAASPSPSPEREPIAPALSTPRNIARLNHSRGSMRMAQMNGTLREARRIEEMLAKQAEAARGELACKESLHALPHVLFTPAAQITDVKMTSYAATSHGSSCTAYPASHG